MSAGNWLPAFRKDIVIDIKETLRFSLASVTTYQLTQRKILEELKLHKDCCRNQKSHVIIIVYPSADTLYFIKVLPTLLLYTLVKYKPKVP